MNANIPQTSTLPEPGFYIVTGYLLRQFDNVPLTGVHVGEQGARLCFVAERWEPDPNKPGWSRVKYRFDLSCTYAPSLPGKRQYYYAPDDWFVDKYSQAWKLTAEYLAPEHLPKK